ncbi:MAG TPA: radical SAM protein [Syntrophorhabdales bacterium]|nr:radical SAM protein [Syntrophorhabdales bacterium]
MYEQGVIRPPSEAASLLVRVSRNCPWNQCVFCPAYKGTKFSKRTVDEVKKDIDVMAAEHRGVRVTSAFLQDADSLLLPTGDLIAILEYLREKFPKIDRITTYARARTLKRKSVDDLRSLGEAGLTRVHAGLESGSETVLKLIKKGLTPEEIVTGGRHVMDAGLELSEYVMPGIGGRALSEEHAVETAKVLNLVRPHFIRIRTFAMHPKSPMQRMVEEGTFVPMTDVEIVGEIRLLVDHLDKMHSYFSCNDFSLNLLMEVDGFLDEKKDLMLRELDAFLALSERQKRVYILLQRSGYYRYPLSVVEDEAVLNRVVPEIEKLEKEGGGFDRYIDVLKSYQLPQPQTDDWQ